MCYVTVHTQKIVFVRINTIYVGNPITKWLKKRKKIIQMDVFVCVCVSTFFEFDKTIDLK